MRRRRAARRLHHYLNCSIWCGGCGSRLIVCRAKNRTGVIYPNFICIGRQRDRASCTQRVTVSSSHCRKLSP